MRLLLESKDSKRTFKLNDMGLQRNPQSTSLFVSSLLFVLLSFLLKNIKPMTDYWHPTTSRALMDFVELNYDMSRSLISFQISACFVARFVSTFLNVHFQ